MNLDALAPDLPLWLLCIAVVAVLGPRALRDWLAALRDLRSFRRGE